MTVIGVQEYNRSNITTSIRIRLKPNESVTQDSKLNWKRGNCLGQGSFGKVGA